MDAGTETAEGVLAKPLGCRVPAVVTARDDGDGSPDDGEGAPVHAGQLIRQPIEGAARASGEAGWRTEFGRTGKLLVEGGEDGRNVHPEEIGAGSDGAADVDRSGEGVVVGGFEGFDMVTADLGQFGQIVQGKALRLTG